MLELTTPFRRTEDSAPLLGRDGGTLALKVCGGSHRGRVIQIRAAKCTVGSAAGCTLRLRATGVRPLHCWILRGPSGTVVRRCASGTLLNGLAYEDAPLRRGDRLRIGMVELEVVDCPQRPAEPFPPTEALRPPADDFFLHESKLRELELSLTAANDEIARLEADAQQAWQTSITAAERAEQLRVALEQANVEAGEMRGELEAAQAALASERLQRQQDPQLADLQQQLDETGRQLAASTELQARTAREQAEQAARFAGEREALDRELAQLRRDLDQARDQAGQQSAQMTITMDQVRAETQAQQAQGLQDRCAALEAELQQARDQLATACQARDAASQWETRYQEADKQVELWQAESHGRQSRIEELEQQLAVEQAREAQVEHWQAQAQRQQSEIEELRQQLAAEQARQAQVDAAALQQLENQRRELNEQSAALSADGEQFHAAQRRLTEFEAELRREREALEAERSRQLAELDAQAAQIHQRVSGLEVQAQEFIARQAIQDQSREDLAQRLAACETREQQLTASEAELARRQEEISAGQAELQLERERLQLWVDELQAQADEVERKQAELEAAAARAAAVPPDGGEAAAGSDSQDLKGMDSVLSRLVQSGRWRDANGQIAETPDGGLVEPVGQTIVSDYVGDLAHSPVASQPAIEDAYTAPPAEEEPMPPPSRPAFRDDPVESPDEESIEKYMERLMQRVRGDSTSAPRPAVMPVLQKQLEEPPAAGPAENLPAEQDPVKPEEYLPRSPAPEQSANLAAMRELANTAARTAIEKHHQKSGNKQVAFKLLGAGVLLLGSALLAYWAWQMSSVTAAVGAAIGLLTGTLWALRGFIRFLNAIKLSRPQPAPADASPTADDAVPMAPAETPLAAELASDAEPQTNG